MISTELSYVLAPFLCILQATGADLGGEPCPVESSLRAFLSVTVVYSCAQSQHRRVRAAGPHPGAGRDSEQNDLLAQPDPRYLAQASKAGSQESSSCDGQQGNARARAGEREGNSIIKAAGQKYSQAGCLRGHL